MKHPIIATDIIVPRTARFVLTIRDFRSSPGTITCIVGPNGSGKTTFLEAMAGLTKIKSGSIRLFGHLVDGPMQQIKAHVGYIPDDEQWLIPELSAYEYFALLMDVYCKAGVTSDMQKRVSSLCTSLYLHDIRTPINSLSHGNKKKVQIIAALLHSPKVLIIDELRNGLDPLAIIAAEQLLRQESKNGCSIVAATHDLWWADRFGDRVIMLINGTVAIDESAVAIHKTHGNLERLFISLTKDTYGRS